MYIRNRKTKHIARVKRTTAKAQLFKEGRDFESILVGRLRLVKFIRSITMFGTVGLIKVKDLNTMRHTYYQGICVGDSLKDDAFMIVEGGEIVEMEYLRGLVSPNEK